MGLWYVSSCRETRLCDIHFRYAVFFSHLKKSIKSHATAGIDSGPSFETELLSSTRHCKIWGYDHTAKSFGVPRGLGHRTHFSPYSLSGFDKHDKESNRRMYTLETLMKKNRGFII